ncbi:MAG: hypothetical protein NVS3B7_15400 [Candidatus Elarobacter sp.]
MSTHLPSRQFAGKKVAQSRTSDCSGPKAMVNRVETSRRDRTAIATSIALHLCVVAALLAILRPAFPADDPDERVLLTSIARIERRPPSPPALSRHTPVAAARPSTVAPPELRVAVTTAHAGRTLAVAPEHRHTPLAPAHSAVRAAGSPHRAAPAELPAAAAPLAAPVAQPIPTDPPTSAPATAPPTAAPARQDDGIGNFGETYPAAVDPAARGAFFAGLAGSFDVRITVDENGRATAVDIMRGPADATARDELRSRLLAARFIPAACNGLRCGGTVVLRN